MGAQESALKKPVNGLEIGEEYSKKSNAFKLWTHINPCTINKKIKGTLFTRELQVDDGEIVKRLESGVKLLKQLRHPNVLSFLECSFMSSYISLVTERVEILDICIDSLSPVEIHSGLEQILKAIVFLHSKVEISHNNISPSSIFVCENGEWKLGGFEFARSFENDSSAVKKDLYKASKLPSCSTLEEKVIINEDTPTSYDALGFGKLMDYCLHFMNNLVDDKILTSLLSLSARLTSSIASERGELSPLLSHRAFFNDLTYIVDFLQTVQLRVEYEKNTFYSGLLCRLRSLPQHVISRRLSRLLLSRYVLLEPRSHEELYPELLIPADEEGGHGLLSFELFQTHIVPELLRVFCVRDTSVRIALLSHFDRYAQYLPLNYLEGIVLEEVLLGAHDVDLRLVSSSLKAMAVLVSLLGTEKVCPWKAVKNFVDGTPIVRSPNHNLSSSQLNCLNLPQSATVIPSYKRQEFETIKNADDHSAEKCQRADSEKNDTKEYQNTSLWNDESWSSDWEKREENCQCENEDVANINIAKSQVCSLEAPTVSQVKSTNSNMIGSEFTISVIKREVTEDDFFADMVPEIKTKGTVIDRLMALNELERRHIAKSPSKFAMVHEEMDDIISWDDDVAVDVEDSLREGSMVQFKDPLEETRTRA